MNNNLVLTDVGIKPIGDLVNRKMRIIVGHKVYPTDGFRIDGTYEMYQINTVEGYSVIVPSDCSLSVSFDGIIFKQKLKNITIGDKILLSPPSPHCWDSLNDDNLDGYLLGLLIGDGTISIMGNNMYGRLFFYDPNDGILQYLNNQISDLPVYQDGKDEYVCMFDSVHQLVRDFGLDKTKNILDIIRYGGRNFLCGFLSGFFDADGSAGKDSLRISFAQTNYARMQLVQILLSFLGIRSVVSASPLRHCSYKNKVIHAKKSYNMCINNDDAARFCNLIGFHHAVKRQILDEKIKKRRQYVTCKSGAIVSSIKSIGGQTKYTIDTPAYISNGIIIH